MKKSSKATLRERCARKIQEFQSYTGYLQDKTLQWRMRQREAEHDRRSPFIKKPRLVQALANTAIMFGVCCDEATRIRRNYLARIRYWKRRMAA